jgi:hypothetical protein
MDGGSWRINPPLQERKSMIVALESHLRGRGSEFVLLHRFSGASFVDKRKISCCGPLRLNKAEETAG